MKTEMDKIENKKNEDQVHGESCICGDCRILNAIFKDFLNPKKGGNK